MKSPSKRKVWYLASPYSHKFRVMMWYRYLRTVSTGARLILQGYILLEPIAMCHWHSVFHSMPTGYTFWQTRDRTFIRKSDGILVVDLPGWKESIGVSDEVQYAKSRGLPVFLVSPKTLQFKEI